MHKGGPMRFGIVISVFSLLGLIGSTAAQEEPVVQVYKSPTCGCCSVWVAHLEKNGFTVNTTDVPNTGTIKQEQGVPRRLGSCHTAVVDGYLVEGQVPAEDIKRLLTDRPALKGIAVPGMPIGSPGMEGPNPQPYDVLGFDEQGNVTVFSSH